ncbi:MAG: hypothetical protein IT427_05000 [Pirellulales bacterium]|nr:hypothetical protein [Pirellulales bacterium]
MSRREPNRLHIAPEYAACFRLTRGRVDGLAGAVVGSLQLVFSGKHFTVADPLAGNVRRECFD